MSKYHQLKEFLKYKRKAKTQHGVHSPFVYAFIENVLRKKNTAATNLILATSRHKKLANKIIAYFQCRHILWLTNKEGETETLITIEKERDSQIKLQSERFDFDHFNDLPQPDLYLIDLDDPSDWLQAWEKYKNHIRPGNIVLIISIHHSKAHTNAWERICDEPSVKLSLDLLKAGLLFFKEEFKEKQHFILKYPI